MELIKRKILIEDLISRDPNTYSAMTPYIYVNILLTHNIDDMGMFTDIDYIPNDNNPIKVEDYFSNLNPIITGYTDSKLTSFQSYNRLTPYNTSFILNNGDYTNYNGSLIHGISKITNLSGTTGYTMDANIDSYIGTNNQTTGILYNDYNTTRIIKKQDVINGSMKIPVTTFRFKSEGWNDTNISLSVLTKEEIFLGIISPPEVESDVFIERGVTSVLEPHLKLSEIEGVDHLEMYGNGYYKLIK
jgi:hypothetical protein